MEQDLVDPLPDFVQEVLIDFVILPRRVQIDVNLDLGRCGEYPWVLERHLDGVVYHEDLAIGGGCKQGRHFVSVDDGITEELLKVRLIHKLIIFIILVFIRIIFSRIALCARRCFA
jgi:hypothetical protein